MRRSKTSRMESDEQTAKERFARNLREQREAAGYSQDRFAMHLGMSRGYYSNLERGQHWPSVWTMLRLCRGLNVTSAVLLDGIE